MKQHKRTAMQPTESSNILGAMFRFGVVPMSCRIRIPSLIPRSLLFYDREGHYCCMVPGIDTAEHWSLFCLLLAFRPSNIPVYLRGGSVQTSVGVATLRQTLQFKLLYLTQLPYTDTVPTSSSADPITPGVLAG